MSVFMAAQSSLINWACFLGMGDRLGPYVRCDEYLKRGANMKHFVVLVPPKKTLTILKLPWQWRGVFMSWGSELKQSVDWFIFQKCQTLKLLWVIALLLKEDLKRSAFSQWHVSTLPAQRAGSSCLCLLITAPRSCGDVEKRREGTADCRTES